MRQALGLALCVLLVGCGTSSPRRAGSDYDGPDQAPRPRGQPTTRPADAPVNPCAPTRVHRDSDYTPGGLYAPGVSDAGPAAPIDVSAVREPVPREEPRSRYGNRSPYSVLGKSYRVLDSARGFRERGVASWYGVKFNGRATSSGEIYDICRFTAAHKTLPLPSFVRVTNLDNGRSLIVRVNDRGPFHAGRVMDLSYAAAVRLGVDRTGTARVELEAVGPGHESVTAAADPVPGAGAPPPRREPAFADGEVTLQLGSFGERDNAKRLAGRLREGGVDAVDIDHVEVEGRDLWRVRVGPLPASDLPALRERLRALELPEPRVVRD